MAKKWALITGASSGIGEATAIALDRAGYDLILLARRAERLQAVAAKLQRRDSIVATVDVQKPESVAKFFSERKNELADTEVLVNNAGLARGTDPVNSSSLADWDAMLDTNVRGLLHVTREVLPYMVQKKRGHIVNLGSVAGRWVYPGGAVYCATKFAVRAFSEGLRQDLMGKNIRVTNIEPGMVHTEFSEVRLADKAKADAVYQGMRALTATDIADTILWAIQRPAHVNIQELVIFPTDQAHVGMVHRS